MVIFLILVSSLYLMRLPISYLITRSCSRGCRSPSFFYFFSSVSTSFFITNIIIRYHQYIYHMIRLARQAPAYIYDIFISFFFTISAHISIINSMHLSSGNFLDVGCGTGKPLQSILASIKKLHQKIVGVDLHPQYAEKAMKLFEQEPNVQIYNMDFYKIRDYLNIKFRFIFFSFSFMLMPDPQQALEVAKSILEENQSSRITFILTLNKNKNSILAKIKTNIKRFTSVDFGNVVYEDEFYSVLDHSGLQVLKSIRVQSGLNPLFWFFPVYYVECRPKANDK